MTQPPQTDAARPADDTRRWWTLGIVCAAIFMLLLDITVVNVALPDIQRSLHASFTDLQWVVDAYALTLAALLLSAGSIADLNGRKRVFLTGIALFTVSSLLCGVATSPLFLNLARALQGVGGAIMFATSLSLIAQEFHGRERGTAFGIWGATTGASVAVGPLVGGLLTQTLGWRWIFFVNLPIGIAAVLLGLGRLRESRNPRSSGVDWIGLVTFSGAGFLFVLGVLRGNAEGWTSPLILGLLIGSVVLIAIFVVAELVQPEPMLDLGLFRKPAFTGAQIVAFALSASMFAMFLYITLYLQNVLRLSPLEAGVRVLPITFLSFLCAPIAGKLSAHMPVRVLLGGGLLLVGLGLLLMHGVTETSGWTALLAGFLIAGAGIGLVNPPLASTAVSVVEPQRSGMASGVNSTFRQVGIATGIAVLGAVFQHRVANEFADRTTGRLGSARAHDAGQAIASGAIGKVIAGAPEQARGAIAAAARSAFVASLNEIFLIAAAVAIAGGVAGLVLVRRRDLVVSGHPAESGA
jgi:EmrB/QacA subfamily drug resistance transporter